MGELIEAEPVEVVGWAADSETFLYTTRTEGPAASAVVGVRLRRDGTHDRTVLRGAEAASDLEPWATERAGAVLRYLPFRTTHPSLVADCTQAEHDPWPPDATAGEVFVSPDHRTWVSVATTPRGTALSTGDLPRSLWVHVDPAAEALRADLEARLGGSFDLSFDALQGGLPPATLFSSPVLGDVAGPSALHLPSMARRSACYALTVAPGARVGPAAVDWGEQGGRRWSDAPPVAVDAVETVLATTRTGTLTPSVEGPGTWGVRGASGELRLREGRFSPGGVAAEPDSRVPPVFTPNYTDETTPVDVTFARCADTPRDVLSLTWPVLPSGEAMPGALHVLDLGDDWAAVVAGTVEHDRMMEEMGRVYGPGGAARLVPTGPETHILVDPGADLSPAYALADRWTRGVVTHVGAADNARDDNVVYAAKGWEDAAAELAALLPDGRVERLSWRVPTACLVVALGAP